MAELTYTIPNAKIVEYVDDYVYVNHNDETEVNPDYIDSETTPEIPEFINKYTDVQWVREHILRFIRLQIRKGKKAKYRDSFDSVGVEDVV